MITAPRRAADPALDEFRIDAGAEIEALLRQLLRQGVRVVLSTPDGASLSAPLVEIVDEPGSLCFEPPGDDSALAALQRSDEVLAIAYLDNIRLEFELGPLLLVRSAERSTLRAPLPPLLYRFQRRQAYRVQPLGSNFPRVRLQHPAWPEMPLQLRVLDLSVSGLALRLPPELPLISAGMRLSGVQVELDRDSHFEATLDVHHAADEPAPGGTRLGCAFARLPDGAERALQSFIDLTQRRQRLLQKKG